MYKIDSIGVRLVGSGYVFVGSYSECSDFLTELRNKHPAFFR